MGCRMSSRGGIGKANILLIPPIRGERGATPFLAIGAVAKYLVHRRAGKFVADGLAEAGALKGGVRRVGHDRNVMRA